MNIFEIPNVFLKRYTYEEIRDFSAYIVENYLDFENLKKNSR